jgi:hypothetical protein
VRARENPNLNVLRSVIIFFFGNKMKSPPHRLRDINGLSRRFVLGDNEKTNQLSIPAGLEERGTL